ncbi:MAG: excinuclease ABC subunit C, partial [Desulfovibrio sp.]|nr:excinuclease ABC subunit C [Desulfovibrio sp.]
MRRPDPSAIPPGPGVYLYRDGEGSVVYVGKARRLRRRVLSYFRAEGLAPKTRALMARAETVEFLATTTEKEAFLLEASLIKKHRPRYNILLRDDKQYALFRVNLKAPYPRIEIVRRAGKDGARYFGPFTSALAARETWKLLHRAFPLRRCADRAMKNRVRPCLYHHMGQCLAPCTGKVSEEEYLRQAEGAVRVLDGKSDALLRELEAAMLEASDRLEFERAAALRDQMRAVRQTVERQAAVLPGGGDMDVVGLSPSDKGLALAVVFVRQGAVQGGRAYFWPGLAFEEASELLWSFLGQFYAEFMPPGRILLPWMPLDAEEEEAEDPEDPEIPEDAVNAERQAGEDDPAGVLGGHDAHRASPTLRQRLLHGFAGKAACFGRTFFARPSRRAGLLASLLQGSQIKLLIRLLACLQLRMLRRRLTCGISSDLSRDVPHVPSYESGSWREVRELHRILGHARDRVCRRTACSWGIFRRGCRRDMRRGERLGRLPGSPQRAQRACQLILASLPLHVHGVFG